MIYNYVQGFVGDKSRIRPTEDLFRSSKSCPEEVLCDLKPDIVIVLGKQLGGWLDHLAVDFKGAKVCYWYHPSAPKYFKKREALEAYSEVLAKLAVQEGQSDLRC